MSGTIDVRDSSLQYATSLLEQGLGEYCSFRPMTLGGAAPVAGSTEHDGTITSLLAAALQSYSEVIASDCEMLRGIGNAFDGTDTRIASALRGE